MKPATLAIFRYYPPLCATLMLHHVIALMAGYDTCIHEFIVDSSLVAVIMQLILSLSYHFCVWHRLCILYTYIVSVCIDYQRAVGFEHRILYRGIVLVAGITILIMFVINISRRK